MSGRTQTDLVLGTAGHIDHGKSSLVLALTGTDPDRLAEEKQRGITIELGFARLCGWTRGRYRHPRKACRPGGPAPHRP